jgi:hypothetical protein
LPSIPAKPKKKTDSRSLRKTIAHLIQNRREVHKRKLHQLCAQKQELTWHSCHITVLIPRETCGARLCVKCFSVSSSFFVTACRNEHSWVVSWAPLLHNHADYMLAVCNACSSSCTLSPSLSLSLARVRAETLNVHY